MNHRLGAILTSTLAWITTSHVAIATTGPGDAGADADTHADEIPLVEGRTTVLRIEPRVGRPLEREPEFLAMAPSYRRAIEMDRDQRWMEAAGLYQQALIEIGAAVRFASTPLLEEATFKVDLERRRSRALVPTASPVEEPRPSRGRMPALPAQMPALERARLLRLKLMAVRAATGSVPAGLVAATLAALGQALRRSEARDPGKSAGKSDDARDAPAPGGNPEVRLLLCATRAITGDRTGARLELAHVSQANRTDPARALALATCQAALGYDDDALGSLAVAVYRLGPSTRFLPGQARELRGGNDWDLLRSDPRFDRVFH